MKGCNKGAIWIVQKWQQKSLCKIQYFLGICRIGDINSKLASNVKPLNFMVPFNKRLLHIHAWRRKSWFSMRRVAIHAAPTIVFAFILGLLFSCHTNAHKVPFPFFPFVEAKAPARDLTFMLKKQNIVVPRKLNPDHNHGFKGRMVHSYIPTFSTFIYFFFPIS